MKRVYRLYCEEGLSLRRKKPKRRRAAQPRQERPAGTSPNERWSTDFMSDALADGRKIRVLTVIDTCTRECVALEVATSFRGSDVAQVLTRVGIHRGLQTTVTVDNGTEFTSKALDHWAYRNQLKLDYTRPGKPTDNGFIESFNAAVGVSAYRNTTFRVSPTLATSSQRGGTSTITGGRTARWGRERRRKSVHRLARA